MKKEYNGYITLYLVLTLGILLSLIFVLLEAVRNETMRMETESVMDIGLYSIFGEFNRQLLEQYDLLFIDTSYGQGRPGVRRSEERLLYYMNENFHKEKQNSLLKVRDLTALSCDNVTFECYMYASDRQGQLLRAQIVDYMKDKTGIENLEKVLSQFEIVKKENYLSMDISGKWAEADEHLHNLIAEKKEQTAEEEKPVGLDNPADYVKEIKAQGILTLALPTEKMVSGMTIHPQYYFSHRNISQGIGQLEEEKNFADKAIENTLLRAYFMEKCGSYNKWKETAVLKYQLEYLLSGKESDLENLESVVEQILWIREGINFAYLMSDSKKTAEAESLAAVISLLLFTPEIKDAVKLTLLFAWSYAESVKDVRILLDGNKLPLLKSESTWNTPLSNLFIFTSNLDDYKVEKEGFCYEDYLKFFLSLKSEKELLYRFMDLCEMDIRITEGNEYFQMDGCIGAVKAKVNVSSGYGDGYEITRTYQYE